MPGRRTGNWVYTDRAAEQDAQNALRGDIVRGLIELITNADDAYAKMGGGTGKIRIEVEHRRGAQWRLIVKDRATGMTQNEMESSLIELGARTSGFEKGLSVRGNLGRGAKDLVAFGETLYESIKDGQYAELKLIPNAWDAPPRQRRVTEVDRDRLGIPKKANGTVVTVTVQPPPATPPHNSLKTRLTRHFQLRDIMADPRREVVLVNLSNPTDEDRLQYRASDTPVLRSHAFTVPDYPEAQATLEIRRLPERCQAPSSDPYRPGGILIKGRRAIYENTLFSLEKNPYAEYLHGRLICEYIDTLAETYDDQGPRGRLPTPENPVPIIGRARDGLRHDHPFYVKLRSVIEPILEEVVCEEEERARQGAVRVDNERTRRDLERMAKEAARFMEQELRDVEADALPLGVGTGTARPLIINPEEATCYLGEAKTLTVVASRDGLAPDSEVLITSDPPGVVELVDGPTVRLVPHRKRDDVLVGQIHLQPLAVDIAAIQGEIEGRQAEAIVEVKEERPPPTEPVPPETLEFDRPVYRIGWTRTRSLELRAPLDQCPAGSVVHVSSTAPGIVVLTPHVAIDFDADRGYLVGHVQVEGRGIGAEGTIRAVYQSQSAVCRAMVTREEVGPALQFEIVNKDAGQWRAVWEERDDPATGERIKILEIQGRHPALRRYLGEPPGFPGQDTPLARLLVAEIVADNVCREIARRVDMGRGESDRLDVEAFYSEHYGRMLRLLPRLHELMVPAVSGPTADETIRALNRAVGD
jgi:hypothetical protein